MALITQTNDSVTGANSYASVIDLTTYADSRGIIINSSNLEGLLLTAMDVLESKQYKGEPFKADQSTKWPRMGLGIPRAIKQAQIMLAVAADSQNPLSATTDIQVKRERVEGAVDVEYFENKDAANSSPLLALVDELLAPYLAGAGIGLNFRVYRG